MCLLTVVANTMPGTGCCVPQCKGKGVISTAGQMTVDNRHTEGQMTADKFELGLPMPFCGILLQASDYSL